MRQKNLSQRSITPEISKVKAKTSSNPKCKEFRKTGLDHYDLLGQLFNIGTAIEFLQISSAQLASNSEMKSKNWMPLS
ncbi:hypothetical protein CFP56_037476 [Quercus suber]|uniref:Uncharacterized protein n=1 Tax=Quercus suber TaxID=58331 RepID=A0AAW0J4T4_QUESU